MIQCELCKGSVRVLVKTAEATRPALCVSCFADRHPDLAACLIDFLIAAKGIATMSQIGGIGSPA